MVEDADLDTYWRRLGIPRPGCGECGVVRNPDGSDVTWRCLICGRLVCRDCTLTLPRVAQPITPTLLERVRADFDAEEPPEFMLGAHRDEEGRFRPHQALTTKQHVATALVDDPEGEGGRSIIVLRGGREYLTDTLCSRACWEAAGKPDQ